MLEAEGQDPVGSRKLKFRVVFFVVVCLLTLFSFFKKSTALVGKMCRVTGHTIRASEVYVMK